MNEMIKAERNKICSRKQTRMLFLAGVVLIVAYFFFFQFNYQNVFYDYDLEKMALASGFTAIEQRKEVAEIFEGKLSQNTLLTMQEKIDQAKQATVGQDENSAFSAVHVYRDQAAILEYLTNSDGSFHHQPDWAWNPSLGRSTSGCLGGCSQNGLYGTCTTVRTASFHRLAS